MALFFFFVLSLFFKAHLRNVFYRMGFGDEGIVALSGAHTLGRAMKVHTHTHMRKSFFVICRQKADVVSLLNRLSAVDVHSDEKNNTHTHTNTHDYGAPTAKTHS